MPTRIGEPETYLTDVSPQDKPWDKHRANALTVQKLYQDSDYQRYADRINQCSKLLGFAFEAEDSGQFRYRLRDARFCRCRLCPVCQWRRSLMWRARFFQAVPKVMRDYPTAKWVFLTLTVRNCEVSELRTKLKEMNKAWERLTKRKQFPAIGFVRSTEVTRAYDCYDGSKFLGRHGSTWVIRWEATHKGKTLRLEPTTEAHPHFHCLMMVPASYFSTGYVKQSEWTELWKQAMRIDYTPIVNVKAVKSKKFVDGSNESDLAPGESDVAIAILETMKYGVKEQDLIADRRWLHELTSQLHKTRAISVGGVLKTYITEEEPEDLINEEGEDTTNLTDSVIWFGFREWLQRYVKVEQ